MSNHLLQAELPSGTDAAPVDLVSQALSRSFLVFTIALLLVGAGVALLILSVVAPEQPLRLLGPASIALIAGVGALLMRRGQLQSATRFLAMGAWVAVTLIAFFTGGVQASVTIAYPVIIFLTGWLIGPRMAMAAAGLTVTTTVGLYLAQANGSLPSTYAVPPVLHGIDQIIVYVLSAAMAGFVARMYQNRLGDLRRVGRDLAQRTADMAASKTELQRAQAVANVGSWVYDLVSDTMRLSVEAGRILNLPAGRHLSQEGCFSSIHPQDRGDTQTAWQAALLSGQFDHEHRIIVGDTTRWVRQKAEFERLPDGRALQALGITQDITARKQAEIDLRESERRYRNLVEQTPQPILVHRLGHLLFVNAAAVTLFGARDAQELLAQTTEALIHPDCRAVQRARMLSIHSQIPVQPTIESRFLKLDGTAVDVEVQGTAILYAGEPAIQVAIHDISALKAHQRQLEHVAHFDTLTGLPNRVLLADRLHQGMAQALCHGKQLAVAYLDLDGFKLINDRHGHQVGDLLLKALANRMKATQREDDTLARLGGDEFVAVLLDVEHVDNSLPLLTRLLAAAASPVQIGALHLQVSASLGVTFYPQSDELNADQLLRQADQAMYQAKLAGKNRYHVFDTAQDRSVRGHHESIERIRLALLGREFVLHYQPKVNMRSGRVIGVEALIRWQHPENGLQAPATFLPMIEDHALSIEVGEWVIGSALRQVAQWQARGLRMPISVNIGVHQLQQSEFVPRLRQILASHPEVEPSCLQLEVLETSAMTDMAHVSQVIGDCRELGVTFALDDFGTGYSSLTYLKHLPVSQLKIDQSFVRDMLDDPDDLAILEGIIALAATFRRDVLAEGVETVEHGALLLQLGCELAQGNGIAYPMPAHDLPAWVAAWRPAPLWLNQVLISRDDLPLLLAGIEHRAWLAAVGSYLHNERAVPPPLDAQQCRLGAWLALESAAPGGRRSAYDVIYPLHAQVHAAAATLCALKAAGQGAPALARLAELQGLGRALLAQLSVQA